MTWIVGFQVSRVVHSKKKGVLVWKDSRIKNSCIARYVCEMRRMSRAMYNILCVSYYIRSNLFLQFFFYFSRFRLMHTEAQAQALVHTTSTLLYYQVYSLLAHHHRFSMYLWNLLTYWKLQKMDHRDLQDYLNFTSQPTTIWTSKSLILPTIWTSKSSKTSQVYKLNSQSQR